MALAGKDEEQPFLARGDDGQAPRSPRALGRGFSRFVARPSQAKLLTVVAAIIILTAFFTMRPPGSSEINLSYPDSNAQHSQPQSSRVQPPPAGALSDFKVPSSGSQSDSVPHKSRPSDKLPPQVKNPNVGDLFVIDEDLLDIKEGSKPAPGGKPVKWVIDGDSPDIEENNKAAKTGSKKPAGKKPGGMKAGGQSTGGLTTGGQKTGDVKPGSKTPEAKKPHKFVIDGDAPDFVETSKAMWGDKAAAGKPINVVVDGDSPDIEENSYKAIQGASSASHPLAVHDDDDADPSTPPSKDKKVRPHLTLDDVMKASQEKWKESTKNKPKPKAKPAPVPVPVPVADHPAPTDDTRPLSGADFDPNNPPLAASDGLHLNHAAQMSEEEVQQMEEEEMKKHVEEEHKKQEEQKLQEGEGDKSPWTYYMTKEQEQKMQGRTLDIVVAIYKESAGLIRDRLQELKDLAPMKHLKQIRVFAYVKNEEAEHHDLNLFKEEIHADVVRVIPNKGREGGTYLSHIIENWDDFSEHTLFIQADAHLWDQTRTRIHDYYVPETGMLSLGYTLQKCECYNCHDYWDDSRVYSHIPQIYSAVNGEICPGDTGLLLGYQGQMIVSRNHIKKTRKEIYKHLMDVLEADMKHWIHGEEHPMFEDKVDNPYFGHSMERSWQILFHCSETRLADTCRELDWRRLPRDGDDNCQCLDFEL